ncbi:TRAP transporter small permease [Paucisalibacillus sp. EB02]|uniref:TRAP transporter small permease n=1 Tax=Paucisalibacillus sp. EB02 TaxID=1347087 RepID=UPI0004AEBF05|nr:TRAP transporter small permease [Paucisalibacillus sp. EB02]
MKEKINLMKFLEVLAFIIVIALVGIMFVQVFSRQFLDRIPVWSGEEVATLLLIWLTNVGAAIAAGNNTHLSMDYFFEKLPEKFRSYIQVFVYGIICVFLIFIAYVSIELAWSGRFAFSARLDISMFWYQSSIFVGMSIMFYYYIKLFVRSFLEIKSTKKTT